MTRRENRREDGRHAEMGRKPPGDLGRADIVGDVAREFPLGHPELRQILRNVIRGMLADKEESRGGIAGNRLDGMRRKHEAGTVLRGRSGGNPPLQA